MTAEQQTVHGPGRTAVGRYAPSPSGPLHLGNLRTAIAAWLAARSTGGRFLVRIDDLDPERSRDVHVRQQLADLAALGLDWDDEPVRQSARADVYREVLAQLAADDRTYPCYCTRAEIREAASAPHGELPEGAYAGTCATLDAAGRAAHERAGRPACVRVRARTEHVEFEDRIAGPQRGDVDDFVVARKDGVAAYNLAVVVDDDASGVTEVVRGRDLLPTTLRQAWLADLLGMARPVWAHVPLVLGPGGERLAKRDGAVTLADQRDAGRDADAVRDALLASLGAEPGALVEVVAGFTLGQIPPGDVRFDPETLELVPGGRSE